MPNDWCVSQSVAVIWRWGIGFQSSSDPEGEHKHQESVHISSVSNTALTGKVPHKVTPHNLPHIKRLIGRENPGLAGSSWVRSCRAEDRIYTGLWGHEGVLSRVVRNWRDYVGKLGESSEIGAIFFFCRARPDHSSISGARRATNYHSRSLGCRAWPL